MRILAAVPVFNEHQHVGPVLDKIKRFAPDLLAIDDGSTDGTADLLAQRNDIHLIRHPKNQGYGQSLIDAFRFADQNGFDWVITIDCDEQHEPEMIPEFVRQIKTDNYDLISGSRYLRSDNSDDMPPVDRRSINVTITAILNDLFHFNITDAFCGFKAHRVAAMRKLQLDETGYAFPLQLWPQVVAAHFRITEIPVRLIYKDPTRHFGGALDDPGQRLQHYLAVLRRELHRLGRWPVPQTEDACCCAS